MIEYWNRAVARIQKRICAKTFRDVRKTPPSSFKYNPELVIVSQVYSGALDMSLLALKSFVHSIGEGRVEIIDDGSLTPSDIEILHQHLPHLTVTHMGTVDLGKCPSGGCWERLIHLLRLSQDAYVIQVDTDTLTIAPVPEVYQHFKNNRAFTIGEPSWPEPIPVEYISQVSARKKLSHIQVKSEQLLNQIQSIPLTHYCRACAAFAGFPKGTITFEMLEAFSCEMEGLLGKDKWSEWGSEQFSSNVMISLCPEAQILSWPNYLNHGFPFLTSSGDTDQDYLRQTSVLHFIGTYRYKHNVYKKLARHVINNLLS